MSTDLETPAPAVTPSTLALPAELTIYAVGELHPVWREWVAQGGCDADASAVDQLDGAGVQLLLALGHSVQAQARTLQLHRPSQALRDACSALGLAAWLETHTAEVTP